MATITQGAKVALFVIALAAFGVFVWRMVSKDARPGGTYMVFTRLGDATGLVVRSRVKIAGIPVGYIDSIALDGNKARVNIRVDRGVAIHANGNAAKRSTSLLGEYALVLTPGTAELPQIPDGGEVPSLDSATTDKIMEDLAVIAEKVRAVSTQAAGAFGTEEGGRQMKEILKNLSEVSREINETVKENRRSVTESIRNIENITERSVPKINNILANVESVTGDFREMLEADRSHAPPGSGMAAARESLEHIRDASKTLDSSLHHADNVLGRIDRGEGTMGRLTKDSALINDVEGVASDIHELTSGITRVQAVIAARAEYLLRANGIKTTVELRLQPREDKYYLIELITDPRGSTNISQVDVQSTNPNQPAFYRETRTVTTNDFRFSFMMARRLFQCGSTPFCGITFLFGIRESTGGLGMVLHGIDDRLEMRTDLFAFGENIRPRLREHVSFEFVKRLWAVAGVDDILNPDRTDFFFGFQLRFIDEDIKAILPFASVRP